MSEIEKKQFNYILYSTLGCHLCDEVMQLLTYHFSNKVHEIAVCDIATDDTLINLYGEKIPVLEHVVSGDCLYWPFTQSALAQFLKV